MRTRKFPFRVWPDSESAVSVYKKFRTLEEADEFASSFVHKYDNPDAERVILHVEDIDSDETVGTYENLNKCDLCV